MCYSLSNYSHSVTIINKSYIITGQDRPFWMQEVEAPKISRQSAQGGGKVVSSTHRSRLPPGDTSGTHFRQSLSRPQGHSAAGRIRSVKNSNGTIGNRTSVLSAQPQLTAPPHTPLQSSIFYSKGYFTVP
jgi:hypothetical protein